MQKELTWLLVVVIFQILLVVYSNTNYRHISCSADSKKDFAFDVAIITAPRPLFSATDHYLHVTLASLGASDVDENQVYYVFVSSPHTTNYSCLSLIGKFYDHFPQIKVYQIEG